MKILFVDDEDSIRQLYVLYLENVIENLEVTEACSANHAIKILSKDSNFDLITSDYNMPDGNGGVLYGHVKNNFPNIPFLLLTSEYLEDLKEFSDLQQTNPINRALLKPFPRPDFEKSVLEMLQASGKKISALDRDYKKVRMIHFLKFNKVLCDVYIRLSDIKFVKLINKGDTYSKDTVRKYIKKNQKYLYITSEEYDNFSVGFSKTPFLVEDQTIDQSDIEKAVTSSIEIAQEIIETVGITPTVTKLVNHSFEQIDREFKSHERLMQLINFQKNREDYVSEHSYLVGYVSELICTGMQWDSPNTRKKLCHSAFFHDIIIRNAELAYALDIDEDLLWNFEEDDVERAKQHVFDIPGLLKTTNDIPSNVDTIIEQHHENPEQKGYPKKLHSMNIFSLSGVFNVAHAFVNELYKEDFDEDKYDEILDNIIKRFSKGHYREPAMALKKNIKALEIK